uniref:Peptidase M60 domain-containing protein n=1 Tax=Podarcis muralis TaxID=64176 RepID=A0A670JAR1_PODMU
MHFPLSLIPCPPVPSALKQPADQGRRWETCISPSPSSRALLSRHTQGASGSAEMLGTRHFPLSLIPCPPVPGAQPHSMAPVHCIHPITRTGIFPYFLGAKKCVLWSKNYGKWSFLPHTDKATCNLWPVYVNEMVLNIPRERSHPELNPSGAQLKDFTRWTALEPYLQLQEAFGWDPYIRIFAEYQKITSISNDNTFKMNQWAIRFSAEVKKDLGPFFKAWGWPITDELIQELARSFGPWLAQNRPLATQIPL